MPHAWRGAKSARPDDIVKFLELLMALVVPQEVSQPRKNVQEEIAFLLPLRFVSGNKSFRGLYKKNREKL